MEGIKEWGVGRHINKNVDYTEKRCRLSRDGDAGHESNVLFQSVRPVRGHRLFTGHKTDPCRSQTVAGARVRAGEYLMSCQNRPLPIGPALLGRPAGRPSRVSTRFSPQMAALSCAIDTHV